jgi:hypothetical protein
MPAPSLVVQTTYAELLERCAAAAFGESFPDDGTFTPKTIKGRKAARNGMLGRNLQNCSSGSRSISKREMMNASVEH